MQPDDEPDELTTNPVSGLPVIRLGRRLTNGDVARFLAEEELADEQ